MINDVIVIDDVISKAYQKKLHDVFLGEMEINWYLLNDISLPSKGVKKATPGLVHPMYEDSRGGISSPYYNLVLPMILEACEKINFTYFNTFRGRSFLQFPIGLGPNNPHTDMDQDHLVVLYYINDTDGDTIIFEETDKELPRIPGLSIQDLTEKTRVTPKQGRVVLFNGHHYHCSSNPTSDKRCILNFDVYGVINDT